MQDIINSMPKGILGLLTLGVVLYIVSIPFILVRLRAFPYWEQLRKTGVEVKKAVTSGHISDDVSTKKYILAQLIRQSERNHWKANLYMGVAVFAAASCIYVMPASLSGSSGQDWIGVVAATMILMGSLHLFTRKRKTIVAGMILLDGIKQILSIKGNLTVKDIINTNGQLLRNVQLGLGTI